MDSHGPCGVAELGGGPRRGSIGDSEVSGGQARPEDFQVAAVEHFLEAIHGFATPGSLTIAEVQKIQVSPQMSHTLQAMVGRVSGRLISLVEPPPLAVPDVSFVDPEIPSPMQISDCEIIDSDAAASAPCVAERGSMGGLAQPPGKARNASAKRHQNQKHFHLPCVQLQCTKCRLLSVCRLGEPGGFVLSAANRFLRVHGNCLGYKQIMDKISAWAERMHAEQWCAMAKHPRILKEHGPELFAQMRHFPPWWLPFLHGEADSGASRQGGVVVLDGDDLEAAPEFEAGLAGEKSNMNTKPSLLIKLKGLEAVVRRFRKEREGTRDEDEPADFEACVDTFHDMLKDDHTEQVAAGICCVIAFTFSF